MEAAVMTEAPEVEVVEAEVIEADAVVVAKKVVAVPTTQLKPDEPDGDEEEDGDDDEGPGTYCVIYKNGNVSHHDDDRDPEDLQRDFKISKFFPLQPNKGGGAFTEEEWSHIESMEKDDPRRFKKKDARIYYFEIGLGGEYGEVESIDPREITAIIMADNLGPPNFGPADPKDIISDDEIVTELGRRVREEGLSEEKVVRDLKRALAVVAPHHEVPAPRVLGPSQGGEASAPEVPRRGLRQREALQRRLNKE